MSAVSPSEPKLSSDVCKLLSAAVGLALRDCSSEVSLAHVARALQAEEAAASRTVAESSGHTQTGARRSEDSGQQTKYAARATGALSLAEEYARKHNASVDVPHLLAALFHSLRGMPDSERALLGLILRDLDASIPDLALLALLAFEACGFDPWMLGEFTDEASDLISEGLRIAMRFRHEEVCTEHVLVAAARSRARSLDAFRRTSALTPERASEALLAVRPAVVSSKIATSATAFSPSLMRALQQSRVEAVRMLEPRITAVALLVAIVREEDTHMAAVLSRLGTTPTELIEKLTRSGPGQ